MNTWCRQLGKKNVCLVSIHTNAAGNGKQWMNARGWTCYTSRGQTAGDRLADCLYRAAALWLPGHKLRKDYSDNCFFLESDEGRRAIVALHVEGIINYASSTSGK